MLEERGEKGCGGKGEAESLCEGSFFLRTKGFFLGPGNASEGDKKSTGREEASLRGYSQSETAPFGWRGRKN